MRLSIVLLAVFLVTGVPAVPAAMAAESHGKVKLEKQEWPFKGPFGTYDRASVQRGFTVYKQLCSACHAMSKMSYRNLTEIGYSEAQVKAIASEYLIMDGPNDEGEMFERPGRPSDRFKAPFVNRQAAMAANNGAYPPDLSLIVKARKGGADYVYGLLTGYEDPPAGTELMQGQHWNKAMYGHIIAMAPPLADGVISYEDGTEGTLHQYAYDVAQFLAWASEPHMEARKHTGVKVFIFLLVFAFVMYSVKKKIWKNVH